MKNLGIKLTLYLNYFVFAILLNSVGIVILKSQNIYGVDEVAASTLELFKDLPIAIISFAIASFLPRIGYKKSMLIGLFLVTIGSIQMYYANSFLGAKILFAIVGVSFALIKISVYSLIGIVVNNQKEHNSLMSSIEGVFMIGIALAYFLFPAFNNEQNPDSWLRVYWLLAVMSMASFFILYFIKFDEGDEIPGVNLIDDAKQMMFLLIKIVVLVFIISAFLFVMVEQGIMTWLPTFNERVLKLPENIGVMMASILAISLAVGRLFAGYITKYVSWFWVVIVSTVGAMVIVVAILPKVLNIDVVEINSIMDIPLIGFVFPLIGLFIAPIYPLLNSAILSVLPIKLHSPMTGLIVIFSALGGTLGSRIIGWLFKNVGADKAFYFLLIPMILLIIAFVVLDRLTKNLAKNNLKLI
ncbi:MAG: MFS transporter [Lutibacter sp.]|nr:MAG: MFS transporter [Lutibacter sp.]